MLPDPASRPASATALLDSGLVTFIESSRPPLPDGTYDVKVTQSVANADPHAPAPATFDESYVNTRSFQVRGDRFALAPDDIGSVFPPSMSTGEYHDTLPHVVFQRATLPWERDAGDPAGSAWLALLLFDDADPAPPTLTIMAGDLTPAAFPHAKDAAPTASSLPADAVSYPQLTLAYGEFPWQPCSAIDVPVALFRRVAPGIVDLPWLSHARSVAPTKPARMGFTTDVDGPIETSVVIGNRLPDPDVRCTVHLVSIEGMAPLLATGDDYAPAPILLPGGEPAATVRLVSLNSWTYRSVDPEQSFTALLKNLDAVDDLRVLAIADGEGDGAADDPAAYVANALAMGYVAMNHQTRQGSRTVSWYRGPFVPFAADQPIVVPVPGDATGAIETADQALRYDPDTGMLDLSYAAAWQVGRSLALADPTFSRALYEWKRANTRAVVAAFERAVLADALDDALNPIPLPPDPQKIPRAAGEFIVQRLKRHLVGGGGEQR